MGEGPKSPESVSPTTPETSVGRRGFLKRMLGAAGAGLAAAMLGTKKTEAQGLFDPIPTPVPDPSQPEQKPNQAPENGSVLIPVKPSKRDNPEYTDYEIKKTPDDFKAPVEKMVEHASNFLSKKEKIVANFASPGKFTKVSVRYSPASLGEMAPQVNIHYSDVDNQPWEYTYLLVGENIGKVINKSHGDEIGEQFSGVLVEHADINLSSIKTNKRVDEVARLTALLPYFDFSNYVDGINREDLNKTLVGSENVEDSLVEKTYAIWMLQSEKLAQKIEQTPSNMQKKVANVFLGGLICFLDAANPNAKFEDLGLNKKSIDKIASLSENERYKSYIKEKIENMGNVINLAPKVGNDSKAA